MFRSIYYKEFIKTRVAIIVVVVLTLTSILSQLVSLSAEYRTLGAVSSNISHLMTNAETPIVFCIAPLMCGLILALTQYVPEAINGRLKLSLHLPMSEERIVLIMLSFGWLVLLAASLMAAILHIVWQLTLFTSPLVWSSTLTILPCCMLTLIAYSFGAAACLDSSLRSRISWGVALILASLCIIFMPGDPESRWPLALAITLMSSPAPFLAAWRFKSGKRN